MSKHVVLGVTGSIAAYKAAELVRLIKIREWDVSVVMTEGATEFVGPLTFQTLSQNAVSVGMFEKSADWCPQHISLADRANVMVIAPCTANVMAKMAHGLADDLLSCTALAMNVPVIVAPSMNEKMWDNPATQENVRILKERGVTVLDVDSGDLACGYKGRGRMAALETIIEAIEKEMVP